MQLDFHELKFVLRECAATPTSTTFIFELPPRRITISLFGTPKNFARISTTFSFAFPSTGGAETRTMYEPFGCSSTLFTRAFGFTRMVIFMMEDTNLAGHKKAV